MKLEQAIIQYITSVDFIKEAPQKAKKLKEQHENTLRDGSGMQGMYSAADAEKVLTAYNSWKNVETEIAKANEKLITAEAVIKKYLEALQGRSIAYLYVKPEGIVYPRKEYVFSLENGEVTHNHKP